MGWFRRATSAIFGGGKSAANNPADDRYYETYSPGPNAAGIKITADSALKVGAVWRSVAILADTLATLPLRIYKLRTPGLVEGGMDPAPNHPVDDVITLRPNGWMTAAEFWGMMGFHAALRGMAYAEIKPGARGAVDSLIPLHPDRVKPELLPDGTLRFEVRDPKNGTTRILLQEEMLRIPGLTSDGISGLRTVDLASEQIALAMAADQYAARIFSNALNMGGFFSHPGKLTKDAVERLRAMLMQRFSGAANFHKPAILQEGMKYEQASMRARDAQLLEARKWQIGEIGRYWGIPLHMLGVDDQTNRSTVEEQSLNFVRFTVRPWIERIEQAIRRDLIIAPRFYVAKFNLDELERGNMQARADFWAKMLGSGGSPQVLTVNEVRSEEGWNRSDDPAADRLARPTNPAAQPEIAPAEALAALLAPPAPVPTPEAPLAIAPGSVEEVILSGEALVRKEVATLRRLNIRHADDSAAFHKAVVAFYGGFASEVCKKLGVTKDQAKAWCRKRAERVGDAEDVSAEIDALEADMEAEVEAASLSV